MNSVRFDHVENTWQYLCWTPKGDVWQNCSPDVARIHASNPQSRIFVRGKL